VKVIMTPASLDFITPLTLSTLSKNPVHSDFTEDKDSGVWNNHVDLGLWADLFIVAPLSANTMAKMAEGVCDNFLLATFLSARCPVYIAPAMDLDMYQHGSTQENLQKVQENGAILIAPEDGELASGLSGVGRMAEPENILSFIEQDQKKSLPLYGKRALVSAGPTYEMIDPVRFIGNFSTGKMGYAIADELAKQGANVTLVSGPTKIETELSSVERIDVLSAQQMYDACIERFEDMDIAVMSAAVADYRPSEQEDKKIKKKDDTLSLELKKTEDILKKLGELKKEQILVGFALETNNEEQNAKKKLGKKNLDFIVLNSLQDKGAGFGHDTNKVTLIDKQNNIEEFELKSKALVAKDIVSKIKSYF
ncbi:MAG: bifunctional phosphopantothenoylcysteine decarboxylase/phosphopantothenate--cysteine ligase CoaBC, partial [Flavobacteriales bacterium]|nr:bifunctional phosphopantothenoylcysteine decarboxylase/phosphopantothenate--cysteine ligase CoaBC [Flavobacteriales bacterium]